MNWNGDKITRELRTFLKARTLRAAKYVAGYIRINLGKQGSVVPFVASKPFEYPYKWGPELQNSIKAMPGNSPLQAVVLSDAVDMNLNVGHHFSGDEEFGHWWDGWAYDFQTGRIVKVAPAHEVAPRPFLRRGLRECRDAVYTIIAGTGLDVGGSQAA